MTAKFLIGLNVNEPEEKKLKMKNSWDVVGILKVIFKKVLSYLLSLVSVSLSLVLSTHCFPVLIFCFYLYLISCSAREFTYSHIRNVIPLALSDVSFL